MNHDMLRRHLGVLLAVSALALAGCGPDPEKAGDECDPEDGCPDGMVCEPGGEDHICYYTEGGSCSGGTDYCLGDAVCTDGSCLVPPGGNCGGDHCQGDAVCTDGSCQLPAGSECDPTGEDYCLDDLVCEANAEGVGICGIGEGGECDPAEPLCAGSLVCAELLAGGYACYQPVLLKGMVFDATTDAAIEGAHVLALDDLGTAVTDVAVTDVAGNYVLDMPVPRQADGAPSADLDFTLRASAADYQTFPGGLRTALPISTSEAGSAEDGWNIDTTLTDIALIPLPTEEQGRASISGTVVADEGAAGVLVVAEDAGGSGVSAVSDLAGGYTIFNVPDGAHTVSGYAAGIQLVPVDVTVAGTPLEGVDLVASGDALGSISGSVQLVNPGDGDATSVVLVVESTFSDTFVRGEVPRGLRSPLSGAPDVTGAFVIEDVPAGRYVVLAAFENDFLVRDPDPNISGTQIVTVEMTSPGTDVTLDTSFKVTGALAVLSPGVDDPESVTTAPTLIWEDDSSEDFYTVVVYDAYGNLVWCLSDLMACDGGSIPSVSGGGDVSVPYGGPMEPGMYYQFRATSWRSPGGNPGPISTTEDLRGVFYVDSGG